LRRTIGHKPSESLAALRHLHVKEKPTRKRGPRPLRLVRYKGEPLRDFQQSEWMMRAVVPSSELADVLTERYFCSASREMR
jgi:hypothetical protein